MTCRWLYIFYLGLGLILFSVLSALAQTIPFTPAVNYPVGSYPTSVFCADLDGDGDLDLAVANWNSDNISILKNNGDGTFQTKVDYGVGDHPQSVFCADLDGDGDLDLAVANWYSFNVSILKNNGDGTFQTKMDYGVGTQPRSVFCADLDGDGDLDLAVANHNSESVSILKNNGDGAFQAKVDYSAGVYPHSVFCADLDGDGDLDLAVANLGSDAVSILKNNGNGTFQTKVDYAVGVGPRSVFCADLDGDTDLDLAVANDLSNNVSILKNNGDGTFQTKVDYGAGGGPQIIFCADLDGDTDLDLAVANGNSSNVSILKNNGNGTFQTKVDYAAGNGPWSVFCADLDGDLDLDLAVANLYSNNVSILINLRYNVKIKKISDVGNDQGKQVHIDWSFFPSSDNSVTSFSIFRKKDSLLTSNNSVSNLDLASAYPPGQWEWLATIPTFGETLYSAVVPTLADSTIVQGMHWSVFFVRAGTDTPTVYFDSPVDSGFSLDNLSPTAPLGLLASCKQAKTKLNWSKVSAEDFNYFTVYRDTVGGFLPDLSNRLGFTIDTTFSDSTAPLGVTYYYLVSAIDFSGNESNPSNQALAIRYILGDANVDAIVDIGDIVYLINYVFYSGTEPNCQ